MGTGWRRAALVALGIWTMVQISVSIMTDSKYKFCDLHLRYNESLCAHQGVNSFRIWNREISLPGFVPMGRPDMSGVQKKDGDLTVHAYPPWHVALFYFYGWLPEIFCLGLVSMLFGMCIYFIVQEVFGLSVKRCRDPVLVAALILSMMAYNATQCFFALNYGVLILTAFLLMRRALDRNHPILAGLAWAVMMIKPQVGLLFFWPLFWRRRFGAIATAVLVCLGATVVTSFLVHESVVDLILQVAEIGKPYGRHPIVDWVLTPMVGPCADKLWMGIFFVLVGAATFVLRRRDFLTVCVPVVVAIPVWTYSQGHDRVILLVWYLALFAKMVDASRFDKWVAYGLFFIATEVFLRCWAVMRQCTNLLPSQDGILYAVQALALVLQFLFVAIFVFEEHGKVPRLRAMPCGNNSDAGDAVQDEIDQT